MHVAGVEAQRLADAKARAVEQSAQRVVPRMGAQDNQQFRDVGAFGNFGQRTPELGKRYISSGIFFLLLGFEPPLKEAAHRHQHAALGGSRQLGSA